MAVVTTSKYPKQNTIILKKGKILFLLMKRKLSKGKKKKSPVKTVPDEMYDLFCSGERRGERE